ncbi:MAG: hypothetical protein JXR31_15610 [Prolixibacteraceae bacterium]|nr:hypothetical protein [Prolixibacteraceae bacterium]MBN2775681.1 hypothetical protein [Prolixibacteraceae bacterium]
MNETFQNVGRFLVSLIFFSLFIPGCEKIEESVVPSVPFSYTINVNLYPEVNITGNSIYIPNIGFGGVIVYCETPGSFNAYDATCTHEVNKSCKVKNEGVTGTCSCCGSEYIFIGGGFPSSGPAQEGLRQYYTSFVNGMLRIYNP